MFIGRWQISIMFRHNTIAVIRESPLSSHHRALRMIRFIIRGKTQPHSRVKKNQLDAQFLLSIATVLSRVGVGLQLPFSSQLA